MTDHNTWTTAYVAVDPGALDVLAHQLAESTLETPDWRMPVYPEDDETFVQFIGIQNALNFCFTDVVDGEKYCVEYNGIPWAGAMGLCAAIMRGRDEGIDLLDMSTLAGLDVAEAAKVFRSDGAPLSLLDERVALLNSLPASLARYDGLFANVIDAAGGHAGQLISKLATEFPAYAGDRWYHPVTKEEIIFDKRARLYAVEYEGRARQSETIQPLWHLETIGAIVDYQLPRALRAVGVLSYSAPLSNAIDNGHLLAPGSEEELAIRCVTETVIDGLVEQVSALSARNLSMVEIDYALWVAGRKADGRHHLTLTTAY